MVENKQTYTYFIQAENGGLIKIGKTVNPKRRLERMQTQCPIKLKFLYIIDGDIEKTLHEQFDEYRVHHGWFQATMIKPFINDLKKGKIFLSSDNIEAEMRKSMDEHIYKIPEKIKIEYNNIDEYLNEYENSLIEDF